MKATFKNTAQSTEISVSDDSLLTNHEIMIDVESNGVEAWHSFSNLSQLNEFIEMLTRMRNRLSDHLTK